MGWCTGAPHRGSRFESGNPLHLNLKIGVEPPSGRPRAGSGPRGASLPELQATLGHGNIATTSGYLHARPKTSAVCTWIQKCFFDRTWANGER